MFCQPILKLDSTFSSIKRIIPKSVDNSEIGLQIPSIDFIWRLIVQGVMYPPFIIPFHKFLEAFIWMFFESLFHGIKPLLHLAISLRMISSCCPKFYANLVQFLFKCRNCTFSLSSHTLQEWHEDYSICFNKRFAFAASGVPGFLLTTS